MQAWGGFYSLIGAAAATLMGLLFVAVSLNAAAILSAAHASARRLAEQAFQNYLAVLGVALLALFPATSLRSFCVAVLGVTGLSAIWVLVRLHQALTAPADREARLHALRRHAASLIGFGMLIIATSRMLFLGTDNRTWLAISTMILLLSATTVSWELLLRIANVKKAA